MMMVRTIRITSSARNCTISRILVLLQSVFRRGGPAIDRLQSYGYHQNRGYGRLAGPLEKSGCALKRRPLFLLPY